MLENPASKDIFKKQIKAHVIDYWEIKLRGEASLLPSLKYFFPNYMSLAKPHPIWTTAGSNPIEVSKAIQQAQFLSHPFINGCDLHFESLYPSSSSFPDNFTLAGTK